MSRHVSLAAALLFAAIPTISVAQTGGHGHDGVQSAADQASSKAFADANAKMHKDMAIKFTGDADVDFVRGMIPHHQGAIDMAKVVQQHGRDAAVKKLAAEIIKAQEQEIAWMKDWLKTRGY